MADTGHSLDLHPESNAYLEAVEGIWAALELEKPRSIERLRNTLDEVSKFGGIGTVEEYNGTREELFVDSNEVEGGIPIYVYKPKSASHESDGVPILVYFHGGGRIMGSRDLVDDTCKMLSRCETCHEFQYTIIELFDIIKSGDQMYHSISSLKLRRVRSQLKTQADCIIVSVEYRLAPEHKFPAMMDDGYAVVRWILDNRSSVGGTTTSKVGVSGDSAGGQIAASVSQQVPGVDFQILIYPLLSGGDRNLPSYEEFKQGPILTGEFMDWMETQVVEKKEDLRDSRYCILRNEKFDHLPQTLLIVAEIDLLRDDSYEYSKRLTAAGVQNEVFLAKGAIHGYFTAPGAFVELCGESYIKAVEFINKVRKQE